MMILNKPKKKSSKSCFSVIFYLSDPNENYPDKKTCIKKAFWLQPQDRASMHELQK